MHKVTHTPCNGSKYSCKLFCGKQVGFESEVMIQMAVEHAGKCLQHICTEKCNV